MSGSAKFLMFAVALVIGVGVYFVVQRDEELRSAVPAATQPPAAATPPPATTAPAPSTPPAPAAASETSVSELYQSCVGRAFPTRAEAGDRAAACSKALQTRQLAPNQIAQARLTRGVARTLLGDGALASEDYIDAVQRYDQLIDPRNPSALNLYRRAAALDGLGETDKALEGYTAAINADPKASLAFLGRGVLLAVRKRAYNRAVEDFDKVLVIDPDNVEALIARGEAFSNLGDIARAMNDLNRAVTLAPGRADARLARGLLESRRGDRVAARKDYEAVLSADPRNVDALVNLAALDLAVGKADAAIKLLDRALAIDDKNALAFYNRGYAHFALRQYEPAIADYSSAIQFDPRMGVAYNNRALVRAIVGTDLVQALADSDEALKLQPANLDVRDTRGFIFLKLGDPSLALNEYNAALTFDPNRAISLWGRGLAEIRLGNTIAGKNDQAAATTINPEVAQDFAIYGLH
ncbi:tetratricopeptide repeat protein [Reyranella sp.]|uniref:tetratricopeptide repeat protein n=1 Tax=Reyranella sp. TaxID=1929291 RepID=UPI003BA86700